MGRHKAVGAGTGRGLVAVWGPVLGLALALGSGLVPGSVGGDALAQSVPTEVDPAPAGPGTAVVRSGLPIPRFVSLRSDQVNVRTGPGVRYPIEWVFVRAGMPVEVTAEFDTWRRIRDWEGTQGWVHQSMLSGRRTMVVIGQTPALRREPSGTAAAIALAEPGVMGRLLGCRADWCRVEAQGLAGWMRRSDIWGVHAGETLEDP